MKILFGVLFALMMTMTAHAGFRAYNGTTDLKIFNSIKCDTNVTCSKVGDKLNIDVNTALVGDGSGVFSGYLNDQVAATATTITAAQCGMTFINAGAVQMELPEASTVLGCRLTFITGNASNFDVNPDDADQILVETDAAGDAIRNATLGNSMTIEAISATQWAPVSTIGTWSDIN